MRAPLLQLSPVVLLVLASGCGDGTRCGPGTRLVGDLCVADSVDASFDGGTSDAAPPPPIEDARLVLDSRVMAVPGLVSCIVPTLLHDDGSEEDLDFGSDVLLVEVDDPSVAEAALPGDCPFGWPGVIGRGAGTSDVRVTLERPGLTAVGQSVAAVVDAGYEVDLIGVQAVRVGGSYRFGDPHGLLAATATEDVPALTGCSCRAVPRYGVLRSGDSSILRVDGEAGSQVLVGVAEGTTELLLDYGAPGLPVHTASSPAWVGDGELGNVVIHLYEDDGDVEHYRQLAPSECVRARLEARYVSDRSYVDFPSEGIAWSATGDLEQDPAEPSRFCAVAPGNGAVRGCLAGVCETVELEITGGPEVEALDVEIVSSTLTEGGGGVPDQHVCPDVTLTARLADGSVEDVTASTAVRWSILWDGVEATYERTRDASGQTVETPSGAPCLDAIPPSGTWTAQTLELTVTYREGSASFELALLPPAG